MTLAVSPHRRRISRGAAMVEFALVAVLMITVLLSVVEMGRFFLAFTAVTNAARSAARYAIVHGGERTGSGFHGPSGPGNTIEVENVARNFLSLGTVDATAATVNVTYPAGNNNIGDPVEVAVSCPYSALLGLLPLNTTLRNTSRGVIVF